MGKKQEELNVYCKYRGNIGTMLKQKQHRKHVLQMSIYASIKDIPCGRLYEIS